MLLFFCYIDLHFLILAIIAQILNSIVELIFPIRIWTKEVKAKMEVYSVTLKAELRKDST